MNENIIIRKATIDDLDKVQKLNEKLFLREFKKFNKFLNVKWTFSEKGKKYFEGLIKYDFVYVSLSLNLEKNKHISIKDLFAIIHYIVPRVVSRNFKDEDGYLIENKFGYFKNAIYSNINKLNFDIDSLWDNDLNDLYSEDDFER